MSQTNETNVTILLRRGLQSVGQSCANGTADTSSSPLIAANNTTINTYSTCKQVVDVGLKREYTWIFIVADIKQPILGVNFLINCSLFVDLQGKCLRDMSTG